MRELALVGFVALGFGLGSYQIQGELIGFGGVNMGLGAACLLAAAGLRLRRLDRAPGTAFGPVADSALLLVATVWAVVLVERAAAIAGTQLDLTFEGAFGLSPAMVTLLDAAEARPERLRMTLYHDANDPRVRRTRALLDQLALGRDIEIRQLELDEHPEDEDRFEIATSNSVVLELGKQWATVERPLEGPLFEALSRLVRPREGVVYIMAGAGEGDVERTDDLGYSGLAEALITEGYEVRTLTAPFVSEIPEDADLLIAIAPERRLREPTLDALRRYLAGGGRLVALLEPGAESGIEKILAEYGLASPDAVIVDPASGPVEGDAPGLSPIAFNYSDHPVARGLDRNRMTFFRRARSFELRKPERSDRLEAVVTASPESWLLPDPDGVGTHTAPERPPDARADYHPIAVTGDYQRGENETRIAAFGDSDFASNRYLRALYNLDLAMNAVHWTAGRDGDVTLRPKVAELVQFPVPIQSTLRALYGVGLLVPELLLICGGIVWLRRRGA